MNDDDHRSIAGLRLLSAAGRVLASSLEYPRTLAQVAGLVVPAMADGFAVEIIEREDLSTVARAGTLGGPEVSLPLVVHERDLGVLRVARGRTFDAFELELLGELASRIAISVDLAQLYAREHHVADTLQRALLPERLPQRDGTSFDAAYLPGGAEAIVGGDWYDAFALPGGRIAVAVGDVAGHGLRAAIVMGEVRQAFRAAAIEAKTPASVIERANAIVNLRERPVMVTAVFGILDPASGVFTYATAGHPPPVIAFADGAPRVLPAEGIPLGVADRVDARDWTTTIPPGATLALYTDGIIEYTRDVVHGEARLLDAFAQVIAEAPAAPARALVERVFADRPNTDDVAVLTVSRADITGECFRFEFTGVPSAVPLVRRAMTRYARHLGLDEDAEFALLTAAGEAVANAVEHAYPVTPGLIRVHVDPAPGGLVTTIEDEGRWRPASRRNERGRGLPLMKALMAGVEIRTEPSRTCVRLTLACEPGTVHTVNPSGRVGNR